MSSKYVNKSFSIFLPGAFTSHTKAFLAVHFLSAHPGPYSPFACTIQFSASFPSGSPGSHSEKGIGAPLTQT